jgi:hypothetical protein
MVFFSQKTSLLLVPIFSPMFFAFPDDASPATRHARVAKCGKTNKRVHVVRGVERRESFFFSRPPRVFIVACDIST